jgi:Xaa-Pro aminopeptidase
MTRTVAFGEPPDQLREVYEIVRRAQAAGVAAVRAGVPGAAVDRATRDPITEAGFAEQYRHPVGHGVGLEIHEQPWLRQGNDEPLPEGAVVTVEPGVYLEGIGGVRIEDMVAVEQGGGRVLPLTPKELMVL